MAFLPQIPVVEIQYSSKGSEPIQCFPDFLELNLWKLDNYLSQSPKSNGTLKIRFSTRRSKPNVVLEFRHKFLLKTDDDTI